jgi:hypothetical protein
MNQGRKPKLTLEQYKRAIECKRVLAETPRLVDLEAQWGMKHNTLSHIVRQGIKQYDYIIMKENADKKRALREARRTDK